MPKFVAFLRAINVGGAKVIKMDVLRGMFESFGMQNVQTFIQSGNVIFETKAALTLEAHLETRLAKSLGYTVEVFLRSMDELAGIVEQPVFTPKDTETLHVTFLRARPPKAQVEKLKPFNSAADTFAVHGREVYNLRHDREASVFSNAFIEKIFGPATTRNMTTLNKIVEKYR